MDPNKGPPVGGFGFGGNILGELKKKQKQTGIYIRQHGSSTGASMESIPADGAEPSVPASTEEVAAPASAAKVPPPLPKRDSEEVGEAPRDEAPPADVPELPPREEELPDEAPREEPRGGVALPVVPPPNGEATLAPTPAPAPAREETKDQGQMVGAGSGLMAALQRRRKIADGEEPPVIVDKEDDKSGKVVAGAAVAATVGVAASSAPRQSARPAPAVPTKPSNWKRTTKPASTAGAERDSKGPYEQPDAGKRAKPAVAAAAATTAAASAATPVAVQPPAQPTPAATQQTSAPKPANSAAVSAAKYKALAIKKRQSSSKSIKEVPTSPIKKSSKAGKDAFFGDAEPETAKAPRGGDPTRDLNVVEWETYQTPEGEPYYVNSKTGETTWDKPAALMSAAESESLAGEYVWVRHPDYAWLPAQVLSREADGSLTVCEQGEGIATDKLEARRYVSAKDVGPAITSPKVLKSLTNDLVQLDFVDEPPIIDLLRRRYMKGKIYTNVGDILIAVNPFKAMTLFTPSIMHSYCGMDKIAMEQPPHPYAIINGAYHDMIEFQKDQSLLISGESGAGKTVTVKVCLEFLSEVAGSEDNSIEYKILAANPILEAFGNAKTLRNDNSSRFGKFMEIHFDTRMGQSHQIVGCSTVNYLLEKSRVVARASGERNFHIFHYMSGQFSDEERKALFLDCPAESFFYLSADGSPCADPDQHDDAKECAKMFQSMEQMGFEKDEMDFVFRSSAAVLHLGNVSFDAEGDTGSVVSGSSTTSLDHFASLTDVDAKALADALTKHVSVQRDGLLTRPFTPETASDARNALARHLYGRMFAWLVQRINSAMAIPGAKYGPGTTNFIGMLDIFGFEIFELNSFEQLCINFANEKLQQMFNRHTFALEEETYRSEGIEFETIDFYDSQPLLDFMGFPAAGQKPVHDGLFQLLNVQTTMGSGTDAKFLQAIIEKGRMKKKLFSDRCRSRTAFKIIHYAGTVEYEVENFVAKNADKLYENIVDCMLSSKNKLVSELFKEDDAPAPGKSLDGRTSRSGSMSGRKTKMSQASLFMSQLQELERKTNATFPRYIRTIKPNSFKRPDLFDAPMSLQQLRFAGVFEAVSIRKRGYPFRHTHEHFFNCFRPVVPSAISKAEWTSARESRSFSTVARKVLEGMATGPVPEATNCQFGKTMVLYRASEHRSLEIKRLLVLNQSAAQIQKLMRGVYVRKHIPDLMVARASLQEAIKARDATALDQEINSASLLFFKIKEAYDAEVVRNAIQQEGKMAPKIAKVLTLDTTLDSTYDQMAALVGDIAEFQVRDPVAFTTVDNVESLFVKFHLVDSQRAVKKQLIVAVEGIEAATAAVSIQELVNALDEAKKTTELGGGDNAFFANEQTLAEQSLAHLKQEVEYVEVTVQHAEYTTIQGEKGRLDLSTLENGGLENFGGAVTQLTEHSPKSKDVRDALKSMTMMYHIRSAVVHACQVAEHADDPEWKEVEAQLREVSGAATETAEGALFAISSDEVGLIGAELAFRSAVDDVVMKLNAGITEVDDEQLAVAIDQAEALGMGQHPEPKVVAVVVEAQDLLPRVRHARASLHQAINAVSESLLDEALFAASSCGYGCEPGRVGYDMVQQAQNLLAWVQELTRQARLAVQVLEVDPCTNIVNGCAEIGLRIPELTVLQEFLALSKDVMLQRQREAAINLANYRRAVRLAIEHKDLIFLRPESKDNYTLKHFPKLKTPEEYAKRFGIGWSRYKDSMLHHYNPMFGKLHTSLTTIECGTDEATKAAQKQATYMFKNITAVMGDKMYENVGGMAQELLSVGLQKVELRDEIYCQVMKQLTNNEKPESMDRGWNLLAMLLFTFPPSPQLENYLEMFIRNHNRTDCLLKLHQVLLGGPLVTAPSMQHIEAIRRPGVTGFWMPGERTQIQLTEDMWEGQERVDQYVEDWKAARYQPPGSDSQRHSFRGGQQPPPPPPSQGQAIAQPPPVPQPGNVAQPPPPPQRTSMAPDAAGMGGPPPPPQRTSVPPPQPGMGGPPPPPQRTSMAPDAAGMGGPPPPPQRTSVPPPQPGMGGPPPPPQRTSVPPPRPGSGGPPPPPRRGSGIL